MAATVALSDSAPVTGLTMVAASDAEMQQEPGEPVELLVEVAATTPKKRALDGADGDKPRAACFMCETPDVKYRCPRCERLTCSLACCVAHKKQFECDGKRDRTKFIPTKRFTDADLSSDFFFLEEIGRSTNSAARSRSQLGVNVKRYGQHKPQAKKRRVVGAAQTLAHGETVNPHVPSDWLTRFPVAFQLLVQHAAKRGVALTLLAPGMSKRVRNTSYMNTKEGKLYWRIEWSFPSAEVAVSLFEERADDSLTPFELLDKYLERRPGNTGLRSKLKPYATPTWQNDAVLLLRKEFTASPQPQYYRLDGRVSLESNLKRKAVVEFPVITVVLRSDLSQYKIANDLIEVLETPSAGSRDDVHEASMDAAAEEQGDDEGEDAGEDVGEDVDEHEEMSRVDAEEHDLVDAGEEAVESSSQEAEDGAVIDPVADADADTDAEMEQAS